MLRSVLTRASTTDPSLSRLRAAVAVLFALDGFVFGSWAARVPDVSAATGADHTSLGIALLCLSLGALACMQVTGALCRRLGTGLTAALAGTAASASAVLPGFATGVPGLCAGLLVFGAATGAVNVAANSVGVQVEARAGRPLLSGLHAAFSAGGLLGALTGGLASAVGGAAPHPGAGALLRLGGVAWGGPGLGGAGAGPSAAERGGPRARAGVVLGGAAAARSPAGRTARGASGEGAPGPTPVRVVAGGGGGAAASGEGAGPEGGARRLRERVHAAPALAAAGYAGFSSAM